MREGTAIVKEDWGYSMHIVDRKTPDDRTKWKQNGCARIDPKYAAANLELTDEEAKKLESEGVVINPHK